MKKNFWSFSAVLLAALLVSVTAAQAADISFGGQILNRAEVVEGAGNAAGTTDGDASDWQIGERLRLNTTAKASGITAFVQLQAVNAWGTETWLDPDDGTGVDQSGNSASAVGVHQANITIPNLYGSGLNMKLGRQEIVLDGHRIFGHTGWHLNAVTHDAAVLVHPGMDLTYAYSFADEHNSDGTNAQQDITAHVVRKGLSLAGGKTAIYFVAADNANGSDRQNWYTAGIRQAGKVGGYDYRVEYYNQFGTIAPATTNEGGTGTWIGGANADMDAYMFGARIGKKVNNTKVTLWYDYLSGNDDGDAANNDWGAFHTLGDTGHKFYGLIDNFVNAAGARTDYLGLQDYAVKIVHPIAPGWTLKADYHYFLTAEDPGDNLVAWVGENGGTNSTCDCSEPELGDEIDLTLKHKYNPNLNIQFGYSWFNGSQTFHNIDSNADNRANHWLYAQADFKF